MGNEYKRYRKSMSNDLIDEENMIKIDKLFKNKKIKENKMNEKKLLSLPSTKIKKRYNKRNKDKGNLNNRRERKMLKRDITFAFDELSKDSGSYDYENLDLDDEDNDYDVSTDSPRNLIETTSEEFSGESNDSQELRVSETSKHDLDQIYHAIDNINKICMEPIKVKVRRDYLKAKNSDNKTKTTEDLRYSADINIVLSNRKDNKEETKCIRLNDTEDKKNDFSLTIETVSDSSKSEPCFSSSNCLTEACLGKQNSEVTGDSVRTLDKLESKNSLSGFSVISKISNRSHTSDYFADKESSSDNSNHINSDVTSEKMLPIDNKVDIYHEVNDKPYYGRTLFYRVHDSPYNTYSPYYYTQSQASSYRMHDPNCLTHSQFGFDSSESFTSSLNAMNEIIIKPPVTIGRSVSFRSNVCKSVLSANKFISDSVFQINWVKPKPKRPWWSFLGCCAV